MIVRTLRKLSSVRYLTASRIILASSFFLSSSLAADRTSSIILDRMSLKPRKEHQVVISADANSEPLSRNLRILDATEPEPSLHRDIDHQPNDIPNPNTAAPEIIPQQVVGPHSDIIGDGGTTVSVKPGVFGSKPAAELGDTTASLPRYMEGRQPDVLNLSPIPNPDTAGLEIKPQQGLVPHSDIHGDGDSAASVQLNTLNFTPVAEMVLPRFQSCPSDDASVSNVAGARPHQVTHQHLGGSNSRANGARDAAPSCYFSLSGLLVIFGPYTRLNQMPLIFSLSIVVALLAIVIQYELGPEIPHNGTGLIRPGWARHRNEVWS